MKNLAVNIKNIVRNEEKKERGLHRYYGEITLGIVIETDLDESEFESVYSEDGLRARLILETHKEEKEVEILGVWQLEMDKF